MLQFTVVSRYSKATKLPSFPFTFFVGLHTQRVKDYEITAGYGFDHTMIGMRLKEGGGRSRPIGSTTSSTGRGTLNGQRAKVGKGSISDETSDHPVRVLPTKKGIGFELLGDGLTTAEIVES